MLCVKAVRDKSDERVKKREGKKFPFEGGWHRNAFSEPNKKNKELRFSPSIKFTLAFHIELLQFFSTLFTVWFSWLLLRPPLKFISTAFLDTR